MQVEGMCLNKVFLKNSGRSFATQGANKLVIETALTTKLTRELKNNAKYA